MKLKDYKEWEKIRTRGKSKYIFTYGLYCGVAMGIELEFLRTLRDVGIAEIFNAKNIIPIIIIGISYGIILGIGYGFFTWGYYEKKWLKARQKKILY